MCWQDIHKVLTHCIYAVCFITPGGIIPKTPDIKFLWEVGKGVSGVSRSRMCVRLPILTVLLLSYKICLSFSASLSLIQCNVDGCGNNVTMV